VIVKLKIKNLEKIIAGWRTVQSSLGNYEPEFRLMLNLYKQAVRARIMNDGVLPEVREYWGQAIKELELDLFRRYKITPNIYREVVRTIGGRYRRVTRTIHWRPLADITLYARELYGYPYPTFPRLYRTGEMLESVIETTGRGHFEEVWARGFRIGANNVVARVNNDQRPYFYISNDLYFIFKKILSIKINSVFRLIRSKAL